MSVTTRDHQLTELVAKSFRTLGEPVRLRIVELLLAEDELSVGELTARLPVSQPRVSVHLACLESCGFTTSRRDGRRTVHRVTGPEVAHLLDAVRRHARRHRAGLAECLRCGSTGHSRCC